ncbi:hypothetical protein C0991_001577 [Blastosporella zonata]|nr:hypothetical protein C0991_001577 [Blastosporella zonata]
MRFSSLFALTSLAVSSFCSTASDVEADIVTLLDSLNTANTAINAFSPTNLAPSPVSETDGRAILNALEGLKPSVDDSATKLAARVAAITALPSIPLLGSPLSLTRADLASLQTALLAMEAAARLAAPADLLDEGNALADQINAALNNTIAAFA